MQEFNADESRRTSPALLCLQHYHQLCTLFHHVVITKLHDSDISSSPATTVVSRFDQSFSFVLSNRLGRTLYSNGQSHD